MICEPWDVVVVPFPFSEGPGSKKRPALVLSRRSFNEKGHTALAMITTKALPSWPGDSPVEDLVSIGLHYPCIVRLKLFTLDNRLILYRTGRLGDGERARVSAEFRQFLI